MYRRFFFLCILASLSLPLAVSAQTGCCLSAASGARGEDMTPGVSIQGRACQNVATLGACSTSGYANGIFYADRICDTTTIGVPVCATPARASGLAVGDAAVRNDPILFTPQVSIPGSKFEAGKKVAISEGDASTGIGEYIAAAFTFVVGAVGFLAAIMITIAGFEWLTAAGNPEKITSAKNRMLNAVMGVVLALLSYTILQIINPYLVTFKGLTVPYVVPITDSEEVANCRGISNNPQDVGCDMSQFVHVGGEIYLARPVSEALAQLMADFQAQGGFAVPINSGFRSRKRQECVYQRDPTIANRPGTSPHEKGRAVDLNVLDLTDEQYTTLIGLTLSSNSKFRNHVYRTAPVEIVIDANDPEYWRKKPERWHFDYTGNDVQLNCNQ